MVTRSDCLGQPGQEAGIGIFHDHHARVLAQLPVQLSFADIDGVHPPGAVLQQAVAEAASGSTHVCTHFIINIDLECL